MMQYVNLNLIRYVWFVVIYNIAVIVWGAYVRATGSGAGCGSHWPLCNGEVLPRAPQVATMIEFTHRGSSGIALILVFVMAWWVYRSVAAGHLARRAAVASVVFMLTEAAIGAGLVLLKLVGDDSSMTRAAYLSVHLVNTFLLVAALALTAWFITYGSVRARRVGAARLLTVIGLVLLTLVGVSGAITALGDTLFPVRSLSEGIAQDLSATAHLFVRLRLWHPVIAVFTGICVSLFSIELARRYPSPELHRLAWVVVTLVLVQIFVGFINVVLLAPVWLQLVHLALADSLWIAYVLVSAATLTHSSHPFAQET